MSKQSSQACTMQHKFLAALSHELKTPLAIVKSYNQLIQSELSEQGASELVKYCSIVDKKVELLAQLIKLMLESIKLGQGQLQFHNQELELCQEVKSIIAQMQRTTDTHKLNLIDQTNHAKVILKFDRKRLFHILSNLIKNAADYSPQAKQVDIYLKERAELIQIEVQDYGPGIEPQDAEHIFEPFFRADDNQGQEGLGMGLFLTKQIIEHYQGKIWFITSHHQGTKFYVQLPKYK